MTGFVSQPCFAPLTVWWLENFLTLGCVRRYGMSVAMQSRRGFIKTLAVAGLASSATAGRAAAGTALPPPADSTAVRAEWCRWLTQIADPVLGALARREFRATMPVEAANPKDRAQYTHLEALGRLLAGLAPWLELPGDDTPEGRERARLGALARKALDAATDPGSPDFMNFSRGGQPLVDAAFLAQALLRAPQELWTKLDERVRGNVIAALKATRVVKPPVSNWVLFASMVEAGLQQAGEARDDVRLFDGLRPWHQWYAGDGWYGDGAEFHTDYYNAYVIHPMLVEVLDVVGGEAAEWGGLRAKAQTRLTRFAAVQERMIAPDGSFPVLGRSIVYRSGAMQGLALAALRHQLPAEVAPALARRALTAVIRRTLGAPDTFDDKGWLQLGLAGHQPALAERYISTGSLYLCTAAFLPLGLPASDSFWRDAAVPTTWEKAWSGADLPADHALRSS